MGGASTLSHVWGKSVAWSMRDRLPWLTTTGPALTLADVAAVVLAVSAAGFAFDLGGGAAWTWSLVLTALLSVLVARAADLHRPRLALSVRTDVPGLVVTALTATAAFTVTTQVAGVAGRHDLAAPATVAVLALLVALVLRTVVYDATRALRHTRVLQRRVAIIGSGPEARRLASTLQSHPEYGLVPLGFVGTGGGEGLRGLPLPFLGDLEDLPSAMAEGRLEHVVFALAEPPGEVELAAVERCLAAPGQVLAVPRFFPGAMTRSRHPAELVGEVPLQWMHRRGASRLTRAVKHLGRSVVSRVRLPPALRVLTSRVRLPLAAGTSSPLSSRTAASRHETKVDTGHLAR